MPTVNEANTDMLGRLEALYVQATVETQSGCLYVRSNSDEFVRALLTRAGKIRQCGFSGTAKVVLRESNARCPETPAVVETGPSVHVSFGTVAWSVCDRTKREIVAFFRTDAETAAERLSELLYLYSLEQV